MLNINKPKLSLDFNYRKPQLANTKKFISSRKNLNQINIEKNKLGDFICIFIILGFICYFIFFGKNIKRNKKATEITKGKLEQIEKLNYNYFINESGDRIIKDNGGYTI